MTPETNPLEAGLIEAIDYEKGCYVGQEVIARATHIGGIPRKLVQVRIDSDSPVAAGASVFAEGQDRAVGRITRSAESPRLEAVIAMARVRTAFATGGGRLAVESGGDRLEADRHNRRRGLPWSSLRSKEYEDEQQNAPGAGGTERLRPQGNGGGAGLTRRDAAAHHAPPAPGGSVFAV